MEGRGLYLSPGGPRTPTLPPLVTGCWQTHPLTLSVTLLGPSPGGMGWGGRSPGWGYGPPRRPPAPGRRTPAQSTGSPGRGGAGHSVRPGAGLGPVVRAVARARAPCPRRDRAWPARWLPASLWPFPGILPPSRTLAPEGLQGRPRPGPARGAGLQPLPGGALSREGQAAPSLGLRRGWGDGVGGDLPCVPGTGLAFCRPPACIAGLVLFLKRASCVGAGSPQAAPLSWDAPGGVTLGREAPSPPHALVRPCDRATPSSAPAGPQ